ncbi:hypothetical protein C8Q76DRAFT_421376 [Earliella scabrosa]|nr:hypothetical protein C8Q76DRAFT_421376 [Earliella scabrosa]
MFRFSPLVALSLASVALAQTYTATYTPGNAPDKTENGQVGTNKCGGGNSQSSMCQNAYVNSLDDWCVFAPPEPNSVIGESERIAVSWCIQGGHGTRVIPDGAIRGAHFVQTPDYVQVTGVGDLTKLNIRAGDAGGEMDPHGADGKGNPIGSLVFSNAFGGMKQMHEWTNFISYNEFCIRACKDGPKAKRYCEHIYDVMGCWWNMPGDYSGGSFDSCKGASGEPMGIYGTSTFHQGQPSTPAAHPAPPKSQCQKVQTIGNGIRVPTAPAEPTTTQPKPSTSSSASPSKSSTPVTTSSSAAPSQSSSVSVAPSTSVSASSSSSTTSSSATLLTPTGSGGRPSAPAAPSSTASSSDSGPAPTAGANGANGENGAAALHGSGVVQMMVAGAAVVIGALVAA